MNAPSYCTFVPLYQQDVNLTITSVIHMSQVDNIPHGDCLFFFPRGDMNPLVWKSQHLSDCFCIGFMLDECVVIMTQQSNKRWR